jgi:hypothetical protein
MMQSGEGTITYSASDPMTVVNKKPPSKGQTTAETANSVYSELEPGPSDRIVQRFAVGSDKLEAGTGGEASSAPGDHPHYLHALSDLRYARALLDKLAMNEQRDELEQQAIDRINSAINGIKQASSEDNKDLKDHPPIDAHLTRSDRYRKALELLDRAHHDVTLEEDNASAQGLQGHIIDELDKAHRIVEKLQEKYNK